MTENNVTVSVVIPTYNRAQLIERAVNSVLRQSYNDLDIIVVDDASTDDTRDRVAALQQVDQRIRYLCHDTNRGSQVARNTGIQAAVGKYIAFLDSDNEWLPQKLYLQMALFSQKADSLGAVYCGFQRVSMDGEMLEEDMPRLRGYIYQQALVDWVADTSTMVVSRDILEKIHGFDDGIKAYQEWDLCIRLARECEFDFIPECLVLYHQHTLPTISKDYLRNAYGFLDLVKAHQMEILQECDAGVLSKHYRTAGRFFIRAGRLDMAKRFFLKSIRTSPMNYKALLSLGGTLLGIKGYLFMYSLLKHFMPNKLQV